MQGRMVAQTQHIRRRCERFGLLSLLTFAAIFLIWVTLHPLGSMGGRWFADLSALVAGLGGGVTTFILAWRMRGQDRTGWLLIGAGTLCWGLGQIYWAYAELIVSQPTPFPSLADIGYLAM